MDPATSSASCGVGRCGKWRAVASGSRGSKAVHIVYMDDDKGRVVGGE